MASSSHIGESGRKRSTNPLATATATTVTSQRL